MTRINAHGMNPFERVMSNVEKTDNGCLVYKGEKNRNGYGRIGANGKKYVQAHRLVYSELVGDIPEGLYVLHKCDNPPCVNPAHLFIGTAKDNAMDRQEKGRGVDNNGENSGMSKLTEENVHEMRAMYADGSKYTELSVVFNVHRSTISSAVNRKSWKHI
jgi:hypothetical protein